MATSRTRVFILFASMFCGFLLAACKNSDSDNDSSENPDPRSRGPEFSAPGNSNDSPIIEAGNTKVFKYAGALQCEPDSGTPPEVMQQELSSVGIDVVCAQTGNDGSAHPAVCGASTGDINVYTIRTVNLPDAEALGFASILLLPDYQDRRCPKPPTGAHSQA